MTTRLLKCCTGSDNNKKDEDKHLSKTAIEEEEEELLRQRKRQNGFNLLFLKRSWKLHGLLFPSWKSATTFLAVLLLLVGAAEEVVGYYVGLISSDYYQVELKECLHYLDRVQTCLNMLQLLADNDLDGFLDHTWYSLELIVSISVIKTIRTFVQKNLVAAWRKSVTKAMHRAYFVNVRFYQLNVLGNFNSMELFFNLILSMLLI